MGDLIKKKKILFLYFPLTKKNACAFSCVIMTYVAKPFDTPDINHSSQFLAVLSCWKENLCHGIKLFYVVWILIHNTQVGSS